MSEDEELIKYLSEHLEYYLDELCKPQPKCADGTAGEFAARGTVSLAKTRLERCVAKESQPA